MAGAIMVGLSACGSGGAQTSANATSSSGAATTTTKAQTSAGINTSLDPCRLVTQQQVAQALNMSVDPGKIGQSAPGSRDCTWNTSAGNNGAGPSTVDSVTVEVVGPPPSLKKLYPTARSYYEFTKKLYSGTQEVTGIGDASFLSHDNHWLYARKGNVVLRVFSTGGSSGTVGNQIEQIMKAAISQV